MTYVQLSSVFLWFDNERVAPEKTKQKGNLISRQWKRSGKESVCPHLHTLHIHPDVVVKAVHMYQGQHVFHPGLSSISLGESKFTYSSKTSRTATADSPKSGRFDAE